MLYTRDNDIHVHSHFTRCSEILRIPKGTFHFTSISARIWNAMVTNSNTNITIRTFKRTYIYCYIYIYCLTH